LTLHVQRSPRSAELNRWPSPAPAPKNSSIICMRRTCRPPSNGVVNHVSTIATAPCMLVGYGTTTSTRMLSSRVEPSPYGLNRRPVVSAATGVPVDGWAITRIHCSEALSAVTICWRNRPAASVTVIIGLLPPIFAEVAHPPRYASDSTCTPPSGTLEPFLTTPYTTPENGLGGGPGVLGPLQATYGNTSAATLMR